MATRLGLRPSFNSLSLHIIAICFFSSRVNFSGRRNGLVELRVDIVFGSVRFRFIGIILWNLHYCSQSSCTRTCICGSVVAGENVAWQPKMTDNLFHKVILQRRPRWHSNYSPLPLNMTSSCLNNSL